MKLVRYSDDGQERFGIAQEGKVADLTSVYQGFSEMIHDLPGLDARKAGLASFDLKASDLLPPVDRRSKILCMAVNYGSHIKEMKTYQTKEPILFSKFYSSLARPYGQITLSGISEVVDYEGEIAVVIGKPARNVKREDAWSHVAGYTLVNDVSARSLFQVPQGPYTMLDWFSCKAVEGWTPIGPWITTCDEAGDFGTLRIETWLNGARVQSESVSDLIFDVPRIVEHVSSRVTLNSGDLISTGTPAGVGISRNRTLEKGDSVKVQSDRLGYLENLVG